MKSFQITEWCHELFLMQAVTGGTYIDATMGNGHDTLFLCEQGKRDRCLHLIFRSRHLNQQEHY